MKKSMCFIVVAMMILGIAGCGDEKVNTVEFYEKNDAAREATIKKCESADKLSAKESAECNNAKRAQQLIGESKAVNFSDLVK
ncbi:EexN family lipoprotein [Campylobacter sp. RM16188]|uniref:EexN family lipoprotein n=1 Tax=Campylobacter sp. RM16188 TaxID=1705725 RepID=UPI0015536837|nr:EexN family lipoprotein [Campylobacter sp. RM16188]